MEEAFSKREDIHGVGFSEGRKGEEPRLNLVEYILTIFSKVHCATGRGKQKEGGLWFRLPKEERGGGGLATAGGKTSGALWGEDLISLHHVAGEKRKNKGTVGLLRSFSREEKGRLFQRGGTGEDDRELKVDERVQSSRSGVEPHLLTAGEAIVTGSKILTFQLRFRRRKGREVMWRQRATVRSVRKQHPSGGTRGED